MRVLITGATGLIGRKTAEVLAAGGDEVWGVSRSPRSELGPFQRWVRWDPASSLAPAGTFESIDAVVHLAGEPIAAGRWTAERKRAIRESRVNGTHNMVESMRASATRPRVLVAGSAVGYYGDRGDQELDEAAPAGTGFLAEVVRAWEEEAIKAVELGARVVLLRTGVVLAPGAGALAKMIPPFRLGVGGRLASGTQWFPWIHVDDEVGIIQLSLVDDRVEGPVNAVSPGAATNQKLTAALGEVLHRPTVFPVPAFALKALFGEMASALLDSQRVIPRRAQELGYRFQHPGLTAALEGCVAAKG